MHHRRGAGRVTLEGRIEKLNQASPPKKYGWLYLLACSCAGADILSVLLIHLFDASEYLEHLLMGVSTLLSVILAVFLILTLQREIQERRVLSQNLLWRQNAQQELRQERDQLQQYLEVAQVMFVVLDQRGMIRLANRKTLEALAMPIEALLGKSWFETAVPAAKSAEVKAIFQELMQGRLQMADYAENYIINSAGEERLIAWHNSQLKDEQGNITGTLSSGLDITHEREDELALQAAYQQLQAANQQLSASAQQLRAYNQQLAASEQQLRAANQQLTASEQQLRAANQQMIAHEQQLRAALQQLSASEQQLRALASQITLAEERERRRIASELHDDICQALALSIFKMQSMEDNYDAKFCHQTRQEIIETITQIIERTRTLMFDLGSVVLYRQGLEAAIEEWLEEQLRGRYRIQYQFQDHGQTKALDENTRVLLFRMVRELLINVIKHAQASHVKVEIGQCGPQIQILVEDNGIGMDLSKTRYGGRKEGGFGLLSILDRIEYLGGKCEIQSRLGGGTRVLLRAPLQRK